MKTERVRATPASRKAKPASAWFVYMLECSDDRIYTGIAVDVAARFEKHCNGTGAAFTRINPPVRVMAAMPCDNRSDASKAESRLKKLPRAKKLLWAEQWAWVEASKS